VQPCIVCGWQPARRRGRDKDVAEVQRGWERAIDKAFDLKDWRWPFGEISVPQELAADACNR
jgi:hypothetical protein